MTDTPESRNERIAVAGQRRGVNHALAWSGIVAAAVFTVAVVFFSGFFIGRAIDGFGGNWGHCQGTPGMMGPGMMGPGMMGPGMMGPGMMGPGMMGPGMMGPQGSWPPGNMGPSGPWGPGQSQPPTTTPTTPRP